MNSKLSALISEVSLAVNSIPTERKKELDKIANTIRKELEEFSSLNVIVVCTHNSRRSQLGEVWINYLAKYFDISNLTAYSGGMEATAFNERMVNALRTSGFEFDEVEKGDNPKYVLKGIDKDDHLMYSKVYDDSANPQSGFMAIMVCSHADENCPIVFGMKYRIPLRYEDPKDFDGTDQEEVAYLYKVKEVGSEIYYLLNKVKHLS